MEGATELAYVEKYAALAHIDLIRSGIEVIDLHGIGGLESDRFATFLRISSEEEVFVYVSIDFDNIKQNPNILALYAKQNLLLAGYKIFHPDFEEDNFSFREVAAIATDLAYQLGLTGNPITAEEIQQEQDISGKAVADVIKKLSSRSDRMWHLEKGKEWGEALAEFAFLNPNKEGLPGTEREIVRIFTLLMRAQSSNYRFTLSGSHVDKDGNVELNVDGR